ncbi:metal-dependent hydrolase [Celeribacter neptunius]|uniref:Inner membrane protein n=1 Tax=Celeribacter neptunius TaxID=588602 RepID=A0A1I3QV03_9RHOB|nr:zinc dependent phospholipase C family protein [Celeribacter neptunius]SFJ37292.1 inner membrane protein [Celeribacter neptunius]
MFIGHLPAAYLAFTTSARRLPRPAFAAGMIASVAPDLDLFLFYFVDHRAVHHHEYISHRPIVWFALTLLGLALSRSRWGLPLAAFGAGGVIHMALDTIAGSINWAWPFGTFGGPLVVVPATRGNWILSFLTHWTFLTEIAICLLAAMVFITSRRRRQADQSNRPVI